MSNMAIDLAKRAAWQEIGVMTAGTVAETALGSLPVRRAASCLLEPQPGDRVLLVVDPAGAAYVLAVLERAMPATSVCLNFPAGVEFRSDDGCIDFVAAAGIGIKTTGVVTVSAAEIDAAAVRADVCVNRLNFVGEWLHACIERIKLTASSLDSVVERVTLHAARSLRQIDEADQLRARQIDHQASEVLHLHGKNAVITASSVVKVDGEQILMG